MLRIPYTDHANAAISERISVLLRDFEKLISAVKGINLRTEDSAYKWKFIRKFMPELYKSHTSELEINCAFCENLVRSSCHKHCLKCRAGTYVHCSPLLPGMLYNNAVSPDSLNDEYIPWYYKNACMNFKRLELKNYFRNFIIPMSPFTIDNFEVLEGLSSGLSSGEKPCRICACVDYDMYKACSSHKDFDKTTPCDRIATLMASKYCS